MYSKTVICSLVIGTAVLFAPALQAHHKPGHNPPGHAKFQGGPSGLKAHNYRGGPPPWAPAHGYRYKHGNKTEYYPRESYTPPFGISQGGCYRQVVGALVGGGTGAVVGSNIGKGSGKDIATVAGAVIGAIIGGSIGRSLDRIDTACMGQVLEHAPNGQTIVWENPENSTRVQMTPVKTYEQNDGRYCREYQTKVMIDGRLEDAYDRACRQPDGSWERSG